MARQIAKKQPTKTAADVPKENVRKTRLVRNHDLEEVDKHMDVDQKDDVIGVKVIDVANAPDPRTRNQQLGPMEEEKVVENEGALIAELAKKKAHANKQGHKATDEDAFNLFIYRVLKEQVPDFSISKKAMRTMNSINAEKFQ